jgi:hypothetical protein
MDIDLFVHSMLVDKQFVDHPWIHYSCVSYIDDEVVIHWDFYLDQQENFYKYLTK